MGVIPIYRRTAATCGVRSTSFCIICLFLPQIPTLTSHHIPIPMGFLTAVPAASEHVIICGHRVSPTDSYSYGVSYSCADSRRPDMISPIIVIIISQIPTATSSHTPAFRSVPFRGGPATPRHASRRDRHASARAEGAAATTQSSSFFVFTDSYSYSYLLSYLTSYSYSAQPVSNDHQTISSNDYP